MVVHMLRADLTHVIYSSARLLGTQKLGLPTYIRAASIRVSTMPPKRTRADFEQNPLTILYTHEWPLMILYTDQWHRTNPTLFGLPTNCKPMFFLNRTDTACSCTVVTDTASHSFGGGFTPEATDTLVGFRWVFRVRYVPGYSERCSVCTKSCQEAFIMQCGHLVCKDCAERKDCAEPC